MLGVAAAEMMDRAGLRSVENKEDITSISSETLSDTATTVLVETRAPSDAVLDKNIALFLSV